MSKFLYRTHTLILAITTLSCTSFASNREKLALVYKGPGSCEYQEYTGCSEAAADIAKSLGYRVEYVGPEGKLDENLWKEADVWIQPGGMVSAQASSMTPALFEKIRTRVSEGMGYVGFCAGAFLASSQFGWSNFDLDLDGKNTYVRGGLGLLPIYGHFFAEDDPIQGSGSIRFYKVQWENKRRSVYWELGPYFNGEEVRKNKSIEITAAYPRPDGTPRSDKIMSLRSTFGRGRVYVTAVHPEAPQDWIDSSGLQDPDGVDFELAQGMIQWVTSR